MLKTNKIYAPVAQLDRVSVYETGGREFESRRVYQKRDRTFCLFIFFNLNIICNNLTVRLLISIILR